MPLLNILLIECNNLGGLYFFKKTDIKLDEKSEEEFDNLLCKFVNDGSGRNIGESVSIDKDILIIKSKVGFLGIPIKHIEDDGKVLLVKGLVDLDKAFEMGKKWSDSSFKDKNEKEEHLRE